MFHHKAAASLDARNVVVERSHIVDAGGNLCGCGTDEPCQVIEANLEPPPPS